MAAATLTRAPVTATTTAAADTGRIAAWDGLRALAVAAVLAYHLRAPWLPGGFLGVSAFFTLSGYLITSLLAGELERTGRIDLAGFWARRLRRLLPAALLCVALVIAFGRWAADAQQLGRLRGDTWATVLHVANWRFLAGDEQYGGVQLSPSPLLHTWSLSIEEQFYLLFPLALAGATWLLGRRRESLWTAVGVLSLGSVVALVMAGGDPMRVYFGTEIRGLELLVGAVAALTVRTSAGPAIRRLAVQAAPPALVGIGISWARADPDSPMLAKGGFALHAVAVAAVVIAAVEPGALRRVLSAKVLVAVGVVSYGIYLYHWPVFLWLTPRRLDLSVTATNAIRLAVTAAVAAISYLLVERPVLTRRRAPAPTLALGLAGSLAAGLAIVVLLPSVGSGEQVRIGDGLAAPPGGAIGRAEAVERAVPAPASPEIGATATPEPAATTTPSTSVAEVPSQSAPASVAPAGPPDPHSLLTPAVPTERRDLGRRPRVLVVGDSVASTLGMGLQRWGAASGAMDVWVSGWWGCPITRGGEIRWVDGVVFAPEPECDWTTRRNAELAEVDPDLVVALSATWEVTDRRLPGEAAWREIEDPAMRSRVRDDLTAFTRLYRDAGTPIVWLEHPAIRPSIMAGLPGPLPEEAPARMSTYNALVREVAVALPGSYVLDLPAYLTATTGDDLGLVRRPDGFHWSERGADEEARWLGPVLAELAVVAS